MPATDDPFAHQTYTVRRKVFKLFGGAFHVYDPAGRVVLYSKLKAFKLKEDIRVFTDESMSVEVLAIRARQIIDFSASYDVADSRDGAAVGAVRRRGFKSTFRDEWVLTDPHDGELGRITEDSLARALVRRFVKAARFFMPQRYHAEIGGQTVCTFAQNFNPFVIKIALDLTPDEEGLLDPRLALAAAILLCAIEGRQG